MQEKVIARWESKSGKYWVEIVRSEAGNLHNRSVWESGSFGAGVTEDEAIAQIEGRLSDFQPDAHKTPMRRVI